MKRELKESYSMEELRAIIHELRGEGGCPWDRTLTYETLKPFIGEETAEVQAAVDHGDMENLCEELGDVLLQILLYSDIADEDGHFSFDDVINGLSRKMIRRHPHVFGDVKAETPEEALEVWNRVKAEEKAEKRKKREAAGQCACGAAPEGE